MQISNHRLRDLIETAHMAGQNDAGVDPGYSNARAYCDKVFEELGFISQPPANKQGGEG